MEPISFRLNDLPTELALIIFKHAAQPPFAQYAPFTRDPYSSALSLCQVSKIVRRAALPEILHTVLLSTTRDLLAFVRALRMQKTYIDQQHDLAFDYASCVYRMSIGHFQGPRSYFPLPMLELEDEFDISLLAPVILGASSLAISFKDINLLSKCLKHACNFDVDLNVDHKNSLLPWSMRSLTLLGSFSPSWWPFMGSVHGYAFLASIQHLTLLESTSFQDQPFQCNCVSEVKFKDSLGHMHPLCIARVPFKGLQTLSLAIPHSKIIPHTNPRPVAQCAPQDVWLKLVTFPASVLPEPCSTQQEIERFIKTGASKSTPYGFLTHLTLFHHRLLYL